MASNAMEESENRREPLLGDGAGIATVHYGRRRSS